MASTPLRRAPLRRSPLRSALAAALALCLVAPACGDDEPAIDNLFLRVTSDAPAGGARIDGLRILFTRGEQRYPANLADPAFNPALDVANDPTSGDGVLIAIRYDGATFDGTDASLQVVGRAAGQPVAIFEGPVDLGAKAIIAVHLTALSAGCDDDGDGFFDCGVPGCCPGGVTAFADCEPEHADANPWGSEDACEPCADELDNDCRGGDSPCVDTDDDGINDCFEVDCGLDDPTVGPGLPELCDAKDNSCNGLTDDGLTLNYQGETLAKGDACGRGICAGGAVECDGEGGMRCSTEALRLAEEICGNELDDNCNGDTDEGCEGDVDGDGWTEAGGDCDDSDSGVFPNNPNEPCCLRAAQGDPEAEARCDKDCDGEVAFCDADDADGDGWTVAAGDCDDTNADVYPGAPERCGDGIDQDCFGGDLACDDLVDADGDGWPADVDCDDDDGDVFPGAVETCNGKDDDCDGLVDDGNPDTSGACGSGEGTCELGAEVCVNSGGVSGEVECRGGQGPVAELCDALDNDCDGDTDEDFEDGPDNVASLEGAVFAGDDGKFLGDACGAGACTGGVVVCDTSDPNRMTLACETPEAPSAEVCDGADNDCDGGTDEDFAPGGTVTYAGGPFAGDAGKALGESCGTGACADGTVVCDGPDALTCDSLGEVAADACDGADNDCDGGIDEDFAPGGTVTYAGGPFAGDAGKALGESCGTGACVGGTVVCDGTDALTCDSLGDASAETCNDADDDCDGVADDPFLPGGTVALTGALFSDDDGKGKGASCGTGACAGGAVVCAAGGASLTCSSEGQAEDEICDGADQSCDGNIDEGLVYATAPFEADRTLGVGDACGTGACAGGTVVCLTTTTLTCTTVEEEAGAETCNDVDDDCDGGTDEDFKDGGASYSDAEYPTDSGLHYGDDCGTGVCDGGTVVCNAAGDGLACDTVVANRSAEICDEMDNDCDGGTDEGILYTNPVWSGDLNKPKGQSCGTGACTGGTVVCRADTTGVTCSSLVNVAPETCNDADDDCDGDTDETFADGNATYTDPLYPTDTALNLGADCGTGVCDGGTVVCNAAGDGLACDAVVANRTDELCNELDDDCDGDTDETFTGGNATYTDPLYPTDTGLHFGADCGTGVCDGGTVVCSDDGEGLACDTVVSNRVDEICDGLDNDCTGSTDAGFDDGDGDEVADCVDNCPTLANPDQTDTSGDGVGDACAGCEPYDVCADCIDNDCDLDVDNVDSDEECVERRVIGLQNRGEALPAGYSVSLRFDHQRYVDAGIADASGSDVRLYWYDAAAFAFVEIDLVLDPASSWNARDTRIWFALQAPLSAGVLSTDYHLYLGTRVASTMRDESAVFHFADLFNRADGDDLGLAWVETEDEADDIVLESGRLFVQTPGDSAHSPSAYTDFPAISGGVWHWRYGFDWTRVPDEGTYRVLMQLGEGAAMGDLDADFPNDGVGVSLAWGGGTATGFPGTGHNHFGYEVAGDITTFATVAGQRDIGVRVAFGAGTQTYTVTTGSDGLSDQAAIPFSTARTSLDRMRFISDRLSNSGAAGRAFDYVIVRRGVANPSDEPFAYLGVKEPVECSLADADLLARYFLDDPADDPLGGATLVIKDAAPAPANLTRATDASGSPSFVLLGSQYALDFAPNATSGAATLAGSGSKLWTGVDGRTQATFELVIENYRAASAQLFTFERNTGERFGLRTAASNSQLELVTSAGVVGRWDVPLSVGERVVLHLVWDTTEGTAAARTRLYVNGQVVPRVAGSPSTTGGQTIDLGTTAAGHIFLLGNRLAANAPLDGWFYYAAIYQRAMSAAEVTENYRVLVRDDDRNPLP